MNREEIRRAWKNRTGEYAPEYYAHYGPNGTSKALQRIIERELGTDAAILEIGCSAGRHLAHLQEQGFDELTGIDINPTAFSVMEAEYPELAKGGTFICASIEDVIQAFPIDEFDAVYSVETLQHLHPELDWVYDELARITSDLLVTVENEGEATTDLPADERVNYVTDELPLYYRDWNKIFTGRGFQEVDVHEGRRDTRRTFRKRA